VKILVQDINHDIVVHAPMMGTRLLNLKGGRGLLDLEALWIPRALQFCEPHAASLNLTFKIFLAPLPIFCQGLRSSTSLSPLFTLKTIMC
jgi:hypothetical protein